MHVHLFGHHPTSTNGAPQTVAVGFASLIFFTLLFPFVESSTSGMTAPDLLVRLLKTEAGFNVFALLVLIAPLVGIAVAITARSAWRVATMLVAVAALVLIPVTIWTLGHGMRTVSNGVETVNPGVGSYVLMLGYLILALTTGITAFRARHS